MFDPKCLELAEYFLPKASDVVKRELAQLIQDSVEMFGDEMERSS